MKILIEGEKYPLTDLKEIFDDPKFYHQEGLDGTILSVGYYHSFSQTSKKAQLIYMLPKVFMKTNQETVFGINKTNLLNLEESETFKHKDEYNWIRQISVYFYNSLLEFKRRNKSSTIVQSSLSTNLSTNLNEQEYSYLDLLLSFVNFYKKNKNNILFKHIEFKSQQARKPNWDKTIRKSIPLITNNKQPIYTVYTNKKKIVNTEEELLVYFFSILNHFNNDHNLYLKIDQSYQLIKDSKFKQLQENGLSKLRKIKYRYFNDTLKKMYHLCEIYFSQTDKSSVRNRKEEFISVKNYNLVFEDMVDKLFSDPIIDKKTKDGISLKNLKYNDDGKIIDHIFDYQSLLDTSDIFYIGDSKYYKSDSKAGKVSKFKQFTYAKNVIQYNIDLLNETGNYYTDKLRYRDELTEGYNITPNFFIYGYIDDYKNFDSDELNEKSDIVKSFHFEERLFDRDTLFVHQYKINFLYVLKAYTQFGAQRIEKFREQTKTRFRENFIDFFSDKSKSDFEFYEFKKNDIEHFVESNFRNINGKCFRTADNKLILARHKNDNTMNEFKTDFKEYVFE
ncbi:hypothetical protein D1816_02555 [Aquimarina sp. AD10]|uniref:hypothetical protein n=1 Tax=Aquimarina sp. AD10 TaxID=1714849 RepID=UPI000E4C7E85|nr:hypothetical protein [Aquimarina sp. AD10]AXT59274.1 hypothetical protein D1816_02555 [Aquimarina sp. AD10]RKM92440.1 hypothetical protein D7033_20965 [Aquimarina sp. AD10]